MNEDEFIYSKGKNPNDKDWTEKIVDEKTFNIFGQDITY